MKILTTIVLLLTVTGVVAAPYPVVTITEIESGAGGFYTVDIESPDNEFWYVLAFGVSNNLAIDAVANNLGWGEDVIDDIRWNSGEQYYRSAGPGEFNDTLLLATGEDGVGSFFDVFGPGAMQAVLFWTGEYYASPIGPNETAGGFEWHGSPPESEAFAIVSGGAAGATPTTAICSGPAGATNSLGSCTVLTPVPLPAAGWLLVLPLALVRRWVFSTQGHSSGRVSA
ncbi:MAG: hypothetical protein H6978_04585 [Gammaproteobacteria bacterium]|nr:hypothetical protein [Gammaproteobacteria bacterium]